MQEIADLLVERGLLTPTEILPELRAVTLRGATLHKEPLTPGTFKKKVVSVNEVEIRGGVGAAIGQAA